MIKKLRFKFILVSLLSILFVLGGTMGAINFHNFRKVEKNANESLTTIIERGFDDMNPPGEGTNPPEEPGDRPEFKEIMTEHYFLVSFTKDGAVKECDFKHIFIVSDEDGLNLAKQIFKGSLAKGKNGNLRYLKTTKDNLTYVAVIDLQSKLSEAKSFLISSAIVSSISYVVLAGLIILASFIVFKPSEESYKKQKQFITNASHELKTPLTVISTDLEIIEMDNGKSEWTESIKDQVNRLTKMTNQLVTLSKMDEGDFKNFPQEEFSLSDAAALCFDTFSPSFALANYDFKYDVESNVKYIGNKPAIDELLHIFLENALKYTKENGKVSASLTKNKNRIYLIFKNDIKQNSEIDVSQLFDRFYRGKDNSKSGSGIGLSIAKEIIRIHKGDIKAKTENGQIIFEIIL